MSEVLRSGSDRYRSPIASASRARNDVDGSAEHQIDGQAAAAGGRQRQAVRSCLLQDQCPFRFALMQTQCESDRLFYHAQRFDEDGTLTQTRVHPDKIAPIINGQFREVPVCAEDSPFRVTVR